MQESDAPRARRLEPEDRNLLLILSLVVAWVAWLFAYTNMWLTPVIGLAVAVITGWMKIIPGEQKGKWWTSYIRPLLAGRRLGTFIWTVLGVSGILWLSCGTFVFDAKAEGAGRLVILRAGSLSEPGAAIALQKEKASNVLRVAWPWGRRYLMTSDGLPTIQKKLYTLERARLVVPRSFWAARPLLLVMPDPEVSLTALKREKDYTLACLITKGNIHDEITFPGRYRGEAICVGCGEGVKTPEHVVETWRRRKGLDLHATVEQGWRRPVALAADRFLEPGDQVTIELRREGGAVYAEARGVTLVAPSTLGEVPQVVELDVASDD